MNLINKLLLLIGLLIIPDIHALPEPSKWPWYVQLGAAITVGTVAATGTKACRPLLKNLINHYKTPTLEYPKQYSINLMWINRDSCPDQPHIYPSNSKNNYGKQYVDTIIQWAKGNPESTINFWFDSSLVSEKTITATREQLEREATKHALSPSSINLKDVRSLQQATKTPEVFTPEIPVYWRTDFFRCVIIKEELEKKPNTCCIYTDFDMTPMAKRALFDKKSLKHLQEHKFVMAHEHNLLQFENSFQMSEYDEQLLKAMQDILIDGNVIRAHSFLQDRQERQQATSILNHPRVWKQHESHFQENVFYTYPLMYTYLAQLRGQSKLTFPGRVESYDPAKDKDIFDAESRILMTMSSALAYITHCPLPTKKISTPPSTSKQRELSRNDIEPTQANS